MMDWDLCMQVDWVVMGQPKVKRREATGAQNLPILMKRNSGTGYDKSWKHLSERKKSNSYLKDN